VGVARQQVFLTAAGEECMPAAPASPGHRAGSGSFYLICSSSSSSSISCTVRGVPD